MGVRIQIEVLPSIASMMGPEAALGSRAEAGMIHLLHPVSPHGPHSRDMTSDALGPAEESCRCGLRAAAEHCERGESASVCPRGEGWRFHLLLRLSAAVGMHVLVKQPASGSCTVLSQSC